MILRWISRIRIHWISRIRSLDGHIRAVARQAGAVPHGHDGTVVLAIHLRLGSARIPDDPVLAGFNGKGGFKEASWCFKLVLFMFNELLNEASCFFKGLMVFQKGFDGTLMGFNEV